VVEVVWLQGEVGGGGGGGGGRGQLKVNDSK